MFRKSRLREKCLENRRLFFTFPSDDHGSLAVKPLGVRRPDAAFLRFVLVESGDSKQGSAPTRPRLVPGFEVPEQDGKSQKSGVGPPHSKGLLLPKYARLLEGL